MASGSWKGIPIDSLVQAVAHQLESLEVRALEQALYLVSTPIGNLSDITLRALHVLSRVDRICCEDTRQTRKLMDRYALKTRLQPYHDHNADQQRPQVIAALAAGETVALVSDAGTPLVSDPGLKLVRDARAAGITVRALPGPSAVLAALTISGLDVDRFFFEGFLPPKGAARRDRLSRLVTIPGALVFYEGPSRVGATLADLATVLGDRPCIVARELTKLHEEHVAGSLSDIAARYDGASVRGEIVILVAPPPRSAEVTDADLIEALDGLLETQSLRDASQDLAAHFGVPRKRIYNLGLQRAAAQKDEP